MTGDQTVAIGDRLRRLRVDAGLSQADLAGKELSPSYISLIEAGRRRPSPETVELLAQRLGCSSSGLLTGESAPLQQLLDLELSYAELALRHGEAASALERLTALRAAADLPREVADRVDHLTARAHQAEGELDAAVSNLRDLFARCLDGTCRLPVAIVGLQLCRCYLDSGDRIQAVRVGEEALKATADQGLVGTDDHLRLAATVVAGYFELGELLHAATLARELIDLAQRCGSRSGQAALYWNSAVIAQTRGRIDEALHLSNRALGLMAEEGTVRDLPRLQIASASILLRAEPPQVAGAIAALDTALPALKDLGSRVDLGVWGMEKASALLLRGAIVEAEMLAREAVVDLAGTRTTESVAAHLTLGDALAAQQRQTEAVASYRDALLVLTGMDANRRTATAWRALADRLIAVGEVEDAVRAYQRGMDAAGVHSERPQPRGTGAGPRPAADHGTAGDQRMPSALSTS